MRDVVALENASMDIVEVEYASMDPAQATVNIGKSKKRPLVFRYILELKCLGSTFRNTMSASPFNK